MAVHCPLLEEKSNVISVGPVIFFAPPKGGPELSRTWFRRDQQRSHPSQTSDKARTIFLVVYVSVGKMHSFLQLWLKVIDGKSQVLILCMFGISSYYQSSFTSYKISIKIPQRSRRAHFHYYEMPVPPPQIDKTFFAGLNEIRGLYGHLGIEASHRGALGSMTAFSRSQLWRVSLSSK